MLEEVQMPVAFDLRIVDRMRAFDTGIGEAATRNEIDVNGQMLVLDIEIDPLDVPRIGNAQRGFKDLVLHELLTKR